MVSHIRSICEMARVMDPYSSTRTSSWSLASWRALTGGYGVETVEDCVTETQTGFQRRRPEQRIDAGELRASLAVVHSVEDHERAELAIRVPDIILDRGEASLWAHALQRGDAWVLCGPDKASLRFGVRMGLRERLVSLERLLDDVGYRQGRPCERRTRGDGWTERSPSSFLWKEAGLHDDVPDHDPRVGKAFMELPRLGGHLAIVRRRRPDGRKTSPCVPEPRRRMVCASPWCGRVAHPGSWLASPGARRRRSTTGSVRPTGMKGVTRAV